ncbi:unnamed protein product, partial [Heterosigma akashiwo]
GGCSRTGCRTTTPATRCTTTWTWRPRSPRGRPRGGGSYGAETTSFEFTMLMQQPKLALGPWKRHIFRGSNEKKRISPRPFDHIIIYRHHHHILHTTTTPCHHHHIHICDTTMITIK